MKRFLLPESYMYVANKAWPGKAALVDIGNGGLAMYYQSDEPWPEASLEGCQIVGHDELFIDQLPVQTVGEQVIPMGEGDAMLVRRRSLKFGTLSINQRFLLECFIWINCIGNC